MSVSIALKSFAAGWAGEMVDRLSLDGFRMLRPPLHTTVIGAEPFFLRAWRVMKWLTTIVANLSYRLLYLHYGIKPRLFLRQ